MTTIRDQRDDPLPEVDPPLLQFCVVLDGDTRAATLVLAALRTVAHIDRMDECLVARQGHERWLVYGVRDDQDRNETERIWIAADRPTDGLRAAITDLAKTLDWRVSLHWGLSETPGMPPRDISALLLRAVPSARPLWERLAMIVVFDLPFVGGVLLIAAEPWGAGAWDIVKTTAILVVLATWGSLRFRATPNKERWSMASGIGFLASFLAVMCYAGGGPTTREGRITTLFLGTFLLGILLWFWWLRAHAPRMNPAFRIAKKWLEARLVEVTLLRDRIREHRCLVCAYRLRGLPTMKCPECGTASVYQPPRATKKMPLDGE